MIAEYADGDFGHRALQRGTAGIVFMPLIGRDAFYTIAQPRFNPARQFRVRQINILARCLMKHGGRAII